MSKLDYLFQNQEELQLLVKLVINVGAPVCKFVRRSVLGNNAIYKIRSFSYKKHVDQVN
jgi:hypothetical protein